MKTFRDGDIVKGTVSKFLYPKYVTRASGYAIWLMHPKGSNQMIKCKGELARDTCVGDKITVNIDRPEIDPQHGPQYEVTCTKEYAWSREGSITYFSGFLFPGIGKVTATKLVDAYGEDAMDIIASDRDRVQKELGLTKKQIDTLYSGVITSSKEKMWVAFLPKLSMEQVNTLISQSVDIQAIRKNPYRVMDYLSLSVSTADKLLGELQIPWYDEERCVQAFKEAYTKYVNDNHFTYVNVSDPNQWQNLYWRFQASLRANDTQMAACHMGANLQYYMQVCQARKWLVCENYKGSWLLYDKDLYDAVHTILDEIVLTANVYTRSSFGPEYDAIIKKRQECCKKMFHRIKKQNPGRALNPEQEKALMAAVENPFSFISGGPGRGKTELIRVLTQVWRMAHPDADILLMAPTGRASKNLRIRTGIEETQTLMRFITTNTSTRDNDRVLFTVGKYKDRKDKSVHLDNNTLVIIDEISMVGFEQIAKVLRLTSRAHRVFVGDKNQLPPIAKGAFFEECLKSGVIPVSNLLQNMRSEGVIDKNSDKILNGDTKLAWNEDFLMIERATAEDTCDTIIAFYQDYLRQGVPEKDLMVLCPTKMTKGGVPSLNERIQDIVNPLWGGNVHILTDRDGYNYVERRGYACPEKYFISRADKDRNDAGNSVDVKIQFRIGDRVMCTQNDYTHRWYEYEDNDPDKDSTEGEGIFNGEIGTLVRYYFPDDRRGGLGLFLVHLDDDRFAFLTSSEMSSFTLGFAMTVHKAQGCETKHVLLSIPPGTANSLLHRAIIYTAITRARESVLIAGGKWLLEHAIRKVDHYDNVVLGEQIRDTIANTRAMWGAPSTT